jgi:SAM-dependent methyltransferase
MTGEMLDLARRNATEAGVSNVEFLKGQIEAIPLPDGGVDVVISNCVVNLATDKPAVFAETFRVLKPGGRFGVSDVVAEDHLTAEQGAERGGWICCFAGALSISEYRRPANSRLHQRRDHPHPPGRRRDALSHHQGNQAKELDPPRPAGRRTSTHTGSTLDCPGD